MNFTNKLEGTEFRSSDGPARPEIQVCEKSRQIYHGPSNRRPGFNPVTATICIDKKTVKLLDMLNHPRTAVHGP